MNNNSPRTQRGAGRGLGLGGSEETQGKKDTGETRWGKWFYRDTGFTTLAGCQRGSRGSSMNPGWSLADRKCLIGDAPCCPRPCSVHLLNIHVQGPPGQEVGSPRYHMLALTR